MIPDEGSLPTILKSHLLNLKRNKELDPVDKIEYLKELECQLDALELVEADLRAGPVSGELMIISICVLYKVPLPCPQYMCWY